jgi:hypothetical protein
MMALVRLLRPRFELDAFVGRGVPRVGEIGALAKAGAPETVGACALVVDPARDRALEGSVGGDSRAAD